MGLNDPIMTDTTNTNIPTVQHRMFRLIVFIYLYYSTVEKRNELLKKYCLYDVIVDLYIASIS